jgi:DNA-directed RNA polymerase beta subunit
MLVFRALGFVHDRHILSHIVYDFTDGEMLERLRCVVARSGSSGSIGVCVCFCACVRTHLRVFVCLHWPLHVRVHPYPSPCAISPPHHHPCCCPSPPHCRPSLEEGRVLQTANAALNFIGTRGAQTEQSARLSRVQFADEVLQKDVLPHVGLERTATCKTRKGFFIGYMVHRLLNCSLGRATEDDRDHFGNKRLDMAGPLVGGLFRSLFYRVTKEMRGQLQRVRGVVAVWPCGRVCVCVGGGGAVGAWRRPAWRVSPWFGCVAERCGKPSKCALGFTVPGRARREPPLQRMNAGENLNIPLSIKNRTLSRGLQSALATGNWGTQPGAPPAKTGVSQVKSHARVARDVAAFLVLVGPAAPLLVAGVRWVRSAHDVCFTWAPSPRGPCVLCVRLCLPGAEPSDVCVVAVASASVQHPAGERGQAG